MKLSICVDVERRSLNPKAVAAVALHALPKRSVICSAQPIACVYGHLRLTDATSTH